MSATLPVFTCGEIKRKMQQRMESANKHDLYMPSKAIRSARPGFVQRCRQDGQGSMRREDTEANLPPLSCEHGP